MSGIAIALVFWGYVLGACLMVAFWSRIPPRQLFGEIFYGVVWPLALLLMVLAAFISAIARAAVDQDGYFAGLAKDVDWTKKQKLQKQVEEAVQQARGHHEKA